MDVTDPFLGFTAVTLSTNGNDFVADSISSGETVACTYGDFSSHFGFFLSLAGISTTNTVMYNYDPHNLTSI
jgi:hypothetical protein